MFLKFNLCYLCSGAYTQVGVGKLFEAATAENQERYGNGVVLRSGVAKGNFIFPYLFVILHF